MDLLAEIANEIERHSVEGIQGCFDRGLSPNALFKGRPLLEELISEYTRSPRFSRCVQTFVDNGLRWPDAELLAVLLDDAEKLEALVKNDGNLVNKKYSFKCSYTPLHQVSLLHICAEFNQVKCAAVLHHFGMDPNTKAGFEEPGFGGHTPIFHTVNQNGNQSLEMLHFLLDHGADTKITVPGLIWGKGYEWETFIPAVNPVSYAMMGLLPQMHRKETTISEVVTLLLEKTYDIRYVPPNIPCAYLR
jgi:hypothetical protein